MEKSNLINEHALNREPVPLTCNPGRMSFFAYFLPKSKFLIAYCPKNEQKAFEATVQF